MTSTWQWTGGKKLLLGEIIVYPTTTPFPLLFKWCFFIELSWECNTLEWLFNCIEAHCQHEQGSKIVEVSLVWSRRWDGECAGNGGRRDRPIILSTPRFYDPFLMSGNSFFTPGILCPSSIQHVKIKMKTATKPVLVCRSLMVHSVSLASFLLSLGFLDDSMTV